MASARIADQGRTGRTGASGSGICPSCGARRMVDSAALLVDDILPRVPLRQWVLSVPFPLRFLFASHPQVMGKALGVVYRCIATHLIHKARLTHASAKTGAVTFIQRFGSALNLNVHFHMLFLDGVYRVSEDGEDDAPPVFRRVKAPSPEELQALVQTISQRLARFLVREGLLVQDAENSYLALESDDEDSPLPHLQQHSITYRIAVGPQQGRKVFTLQTIPPKHGEHPPLSPVGKEAGFSLHAGVTTTAHQRDKLERICRYIARPAVSEKRLSLTRNGQVRYRLKTPYKDGTTHVIFEPLDFIARLAALVPKPRVNLTRFHGVFAPNSRYRITITPAKRGKGKASSSTDDQEASSPEQQRQRMTWARRLKRVFSIDIEVCERCTGPVKVIACIEDPLVIDTILTHLAKKEERERAENNTARAPPAITLIEQQLA